MPKKDLDTVVNIQLYEFRFDFPYRLYVVLDYQTKLFRRWIVPATG